MPRQLYFMAGALSMSSHVVIEVLHQEKEQRDKQFDCSHSGAERRGRCWYRAAAIWWPLRRTAARRAGCMAGSPGLAGNLVSVLSQHGWCPSACRGTYCSIHAQQKGSVIRDCQEFCFMPVHSCQHNLCALVEN